MLTLLEGEDHEEPHALADRADADRRERNVARRRQARELPLRRQSSAGTSLLLAALDPLRPSPHRSRAPHPLVIGPFSFIG